MPAAFSSENLREKTALENLARVGDNKSSILIREWTE
jgi:hypothetical protein